MDIAFETLGFVVKQLREEQRLSRTELAHVAGVQQSDVREVETGKSDPDFDTLIKLADALGVQLSELFSRAERLGVGAPDVVPGKNDSVLSLIQELTVLRRLERLVSCRTRSVADLPRHSHAGLFFETEETRISTMIAPLKSALDNGFRCIYIDDESAADKLVLALAKRCDVNAHKKTGALAVRTKYETYTPHGDFDRKAVIQQFGDLARNAETAGYAGVIVACEMSWALDTQQDLEELVRYEAELNSEFDELNLTLLCLYDTGRFNSPTLRRIAGCHPFVGTHERMFANCFYPPATGSSAIHELHLIMEINRTVSQSDVLEG